MGVEGNLQVIVVVATVVEVGVDMASHAILNFEVCVWEFYFLARRLRTIFGQCCANMLVCICIQLLVVLF